MNAVQVLNGRNFAKAILKTSEVVSALEERLAAN